MHWVPYEAWLNPGDNAWQMTAATFVGLMSVPGLAVLYGGVMQKRWSVNSMMLTFVAFCLVLVAWVLWAFKMGFGESVAHSGSGIFGAHGFLGSALGKPGSVLGHAAEEGQALIEYALILVLVSTAAFTLLSVIGGFPSSVFSEVNAGF